MHRAHLFPRPALTFGASSAGTGTGKWSHKPSANVALPTCALPAPLPPAAGGLRGAPGLPVGMDTGNQGFLK